MRWIWTCHAIVSALRVPFRLLIALLAWVVTALSLVTILLAPTAFGVVELVVRSVNVHRHKAGRARDAGGLRRR